MTTLVEDFDWVGRMGTDIPVALKPLAWSNRSQFLGDLRIVRLCSAKASSE